MQEQARSDDGRQFRLCSPLLDLWVAGAEAQLQAWQGYQVEGTHFIAKRMRANLEFLRALGHCADVPAIFDCQQCWLNVVRNDYAEECGRIIATTFAAALTNTAGMGGLIATRVAEPCTEGRSKSQPNPPAPPVLKTAA
jgi:hypothetical protein